jgi:hypothetical protein
VSARSGGYQSRSDARRDARARPEPPRRRLGGDVVRVERGAALALPLLRERVLACTRAAFGLADAALPHAFAEVVEGEPVPAFLGRLLSAQNQLAAQRAGTLAPAELRRRLADALQAGAEETLDLLALDGSDDAEAVAVIAEVLAEFGRRLAALACGLRE